MERIEVEKQVLEVHRLVEVVGGVSQGREAGTSFGESDGVGTSPSWESPGCDVVAVQRAMGHATSITTLSTYSHQWPTVEDMTRAAASAVLATRLRHN